MENYLEHAKKITEDRKLGTISYQEWGDLLLGAENTYSKENLRKAFYVVSKMLDKVNGIATEDEMFAQLEAIKKEIKIETIKLRDQRRELNKLDTAQARFENLRNIMIEEIGNLPPIELKPYVGQSEANKEASLLISDVHLGITIDNQFNFYNVEEATLRLDTLKNKTIEYCKLHKVRKLNIELLGDLISGHIQVGCRVQQEEDTITQIMLFCELMSNIISELKQHIEEVVVYSVYGNHARLMPDKKQSINCENLERLIPYYLKARLNGVKVIDSNVADYLAYSIGDRKIVLSHGDKDSIANALNNYTRLLGYVPTEIHLAHIHNFNEKDDCDTAIVVNGSLVSSDDYAVSIRKSTKASQVLRIYGDDVCNYKIVLN